ncbi:stage V sporulation protein AB [Alkaliphilus peptidifermentans]|uniref:Stage V sporulation protein AB n=1 Tax=Alkaliphilus peptidifermentans DSM 18978 TaxID=1120976 RepID=A0A1G5JV94_9FIRM|nr:stage V sporulation protein AB [Alkaliphilus peptidifermentans]SCY92237.1 stage V sporulation protein AB [Alkaliphilus peptidifermentans DSM 18978]
MRSVLVIITGLSNGIIVGSGIVALLTLLDIVPRLAQLTNTYKYIQWYENVIVMGAVFAAITSLTDFAISLKAPIVVVIGFFIGTFIGLLASALAEVMNVIPVLIRRFRLEGYVIYILYALIIGKVLGSLLDWLIIK